MLARVQSHGVARLDIGENGGQSRGAHGQVEQVAVSDQEKQKTAGRQCQPLDTQLGQHHYPIDRDDQQVHQQSSHWPYGAKKNLPQKLKTFFEGPEDMEGFDADFSPKW